MTSTYGIILCPLAAGDAMALATVVGQNVTFTQCFASSEHQAGMGSHLWPVLEWAGRDERLGRPRGSYAGLVVERRVVPPRWWWWGHFRVKVKKELPFCSIVCESWEGKPQDLAFGGRWGDWLLKAGDVSEAGEIIEL